MHRYLVILLFLLCGSSAMGQQGKSDTPAIDYTQMGAPMPFFKMVILDTTKKIPLINATSKRKQKEQAIDTVLIAGTMNSTTLRNTGNTWVMLFSPTCEHCEEMTKVLEKNMGLFKNTKLVMMTNPKFKEYLPGFMKRLHTMDYPQLSVGMDDTDFIKNTFLYQSLPQINIYDSNKKLMKIFAGDTPMDTLKRYID